ncbi:MAG: TIR domain-containing protein [Sulfurimonas sp.]|nr:TIR domain-containing protein [Sulfurimonas sp.]
MARKVFFSFKYEDVSRAMVVHNSCVAQGIDCAGFIDKADFEENKKKGDRAIKNWIDKQLEDTSVTVLLVGEKTCKSRWIEYAIRRSMERGNGLMGVDISKIKNLQGEQSQRCGKIPRSHDFYLWDKDDKNNNIGDWIENAVKKAGENKFNLRRSS